MTNSKQAKTPKQQDFEKIVKRETIKLTIAGSLLTLFGIGTVVLAIAESYKLLDPIASGRLVGFGVVVGIVALVIASSRSITKAFIRSSQDEYEYKLNIESRAKAYTLLNYGVLVTIFWVGGMGRGAIRFLAIVLGISWIITARGGGQIDV